MTGTPIPGRVSLGPEAALDPGTGPLELSVVIAAFDAADTIEAQLSALLAQTWDGTWEVVVADNGSRDDTPAVVQRLARSDARLKLAEAPAVRGAAYARNQGVKLARGASIAFCDADDIVAEGWVAAMGEALRRVPFVTGPQEHVDLNPTWLHGLYGTAPRHALQTFAGIFPFGPTANLGIHRDLFESIGGFDTSISAYEDLDLCLRLWLRGIPLEFVPEARVHYRHRATLPDLWRQAVTYGRARPAISRRLSAAGRPTPSRWAGLRNWVWLVRHLPLLRTKAGRARWVVVAGGAAGRVSGSLRHRYLTF